jgi:hypothetical protein
MALFISVKNRVFSNPVVVSSISEISTLLERGHEQSDYTAYYSFSVCSINSYYAKDNKILDYPGFDYIVIKVVSVKTMYPEIFLRPVFAGYIDQDINK